MFFVFVCFVGVGEGEVLVAGLGGAKYLRAGVAAPKHYPRKLTLECFGAGESFEAPTPVHYTNILLRYFSFQPVLHDWCNKGRGMCYPVCEMVHIKDPLMLIGKSSLCGGSGFPFSLSEWSLTI